MGVGASVSSEVAELQKVLARAPGVEEVRLHAYGTSISGPFDAVFSAVEACHTEMHKQGVQRVSTSLKLGTRTDKHQTLADKVDAVEARA